MRLFIIAFLFSLFSCNNQNKLNQVDNYIIKESFGNILSDNNVNGVLLIYDSKDDIYYTNDIITVDNGFLPASTFKIPNSIIAIEENVATIDSIFKWDGETKNIKEWERDLTLKQAFKYSCVHCYQSLARKIGVQSMKENLGRIGYPEMDIKAENIDTFWLSGESRISPMQQIDFLKRFNENKLPIKNSTYSQVKEMMLLIEEENGDLYGKTGLSVDEIMRNGWFVGFVEAGNNTYYFATNITQTADVTNDKFQRIRIPITLLALQDIGIDFLPLKQR